MRKRILRPRGLIALAVFALLGAAWWLIFGERTVESVIEQASTSSLGTQVDISNTRVNLINTTLELSGISVADPFDLSRNLVEARTARMELELEPLLRKKIVVRNFSLGDVQSGTTRATPARAVDTAGFVPRALREIRRFREQVDVPLLSLTPIDTIRSLVLDPTQLVTVQSAMALEKRGDSLRTNFTDRTTRLVQTDILDSARALTEHLKGQTARSLGIAGALRAANDIRRLTGRVDSMRRAVDQLHRDVRGGFDSLSADLRALDQSRRADYDFARGLLALPKFDAPSIGPSLFGDVSIGAFEKGLYWVNLAREHAPPGLRPRTGTGPKRVRRAGTTVNFVQATSYPDFLLRQGSIDLTLSDALGAARGDYSMKVSDVSTEPALVGQPMRFELQRSASASDVQVIGVSGLLDHRGAVARDLVQLHAGGVKLPSFRIPALPLSANPGRGQSAFEISLVGDSLSARWSIESGETAWTRDSSGATSRSRLEELVISVISGVRRLSVDARLTGTLQTPKLSVTSNLDEEIANSLRNVAGAELEKAMQKVRSQVDSLVAAHVAPVREKVNGWRTAVEDQLKEVTAAVDELRAQLSAQLRALGG